MKAIVHEKHGPPEILELREMEKPVPKEYEVLVRVHAGSVNAADWHILRGQSFLVRFMGYGLSKPKNKIRGTDVSSQHVHSQAGISLQWRFRFFRLKGRRPGPHSSSLVVEPTLTTPWL
jgi:hypothetical protein